VGVGGGGGARVIKLTDIIKPEAIVPALATNDVAGVVRELVDALVRSGGVPAALAQDITTRVLHREKTSSTGFGRGVAVPHAKHPGMTGIACAVGLSQRGAEFRSLDRQPVHYVFLLVSPEDAPEDHLKAMESIFKNLGRETFRRALRNCQGVPDVVQVLADADAQHTAV
jgi:mannitol/fructose-specific phosphotransferase system IIA component (Ntr-type)